MRIVVLLGGAILSLTAGAAICLQAGRMPAAKVAIELPPVRASVELPAAIEAATMSASGASTLTFRQVRSVPVMETQAASSAAPVTTSAEKPVSDVASESASRSLQQASNLPQPVAAVQAEAQTKPVSERLPIRAAASERGLARVGHKTAAAQAKSRQAVPPPEAVVPQSVATAPSAPPARRWRTLGDLL